MREKACSHQQAESENPLQKVLPGFADLVRLRLMVLLGHVLGLQSPSAWGEGLLPWRVGTLSILPSGPDFSYGTEGNGRMDDLDGTSRAGRTDSKSLNSGFLPVCR